MEASHNRRLRTLSQHIIAAHRVTTPRDSSTKAARAGTLEEDEEELRRAEAEYQQQGWTCVRGLLGTSVTGRVHSVLSAWADHTIDSWVDQGLLDDPRSHLPFATRLLECWGAAGEPQYSRSPRRDLASADMYEVLSNPQLADLARRLMGTEEVLSHSIFNARPKLPAQPWTDTPWHQVRLRAACLHVGVTCVRPVLDLCGGVWGAGCAILP